MFSKNPFEKKFKNFLNLSKKPEVKKEEVEKIFKQIIEGKQDLKEISQSVEENVFQSALKKAFELKLKNGEEIAEFFNYFSNSIKEELKEKDFLIKKNISQYIPQSDLATIQNLLSLIKDQKQIKKVLIKAILTNIKEGNYISHILQLLNEKDLAIIKKNQKIIIEGILKRLEKSSDLSDYLLLLDKKNKEDFKKKNIKAIENAVINRLKEGVSINDLNKLLTKKAVEAIDLDLIKKAIELSFKKINQIEESYFQGLLKEKSEQALKGLISNFIDKNKKIPENFLSYISFKKIEEIFKEKLINLLKVQVFKPETNFNFINYEYLLKDKKIIDFLEEAIVYLLKNDINFTNESFVIFDKNELQNKVEAIKNKREIQDLFQKKIKELIAEKEIYLFSNYFDFCQDEILKKAFKEGLLEVIKKGEDIDIGYFSKTLNYKLGHDNFGLILTVLNSIKQENKEIIEKAVLKRLKNGESLYFYLNYLLEAEFLDKLKKEKEIQELVKKGFFNRLEKGFSLNDYFDLLNEENRKEIIKIFENEEKLRFYVKKAVFNFFSAELNDDEIKEIDVILDKILKDRSKIFLKKCLLDRTYLPLGLKFYLREKNKSFEKYFETRHFDPNSNFQSRYVTGVVVNPQLLNLCFLTLEEIFKLNKREFQKDIFFQACFPERLDNESCGIATIAFLFLKEKSLKFTPEFFEKNKKRIALTLYDAGYFINGEHVFFSKDRKPFNPFFEGRTDILYCSNLEDIEKIWSVFTLLVHAHYPLKELLAKDLGSNFIKDFKKILGKYDKLDWLENKFVNLERQNITFEDLEKLKNTLLDIVEQRKNNEDLKREIREFVAKYNTLLNSFYSVEAL